MQNGPIFDGNFHDFGSELEKISQQLMR